MQIKDMFKRDIERSINGVVKADQLDDFSVWQELDEFVITHELDGHLRKFFSTYLDAMDRPNDPDISGKIGVWVSGFFGSGKSHFIKVLSYLLENKEHKLNEEHKRAIEFFEPKIKDTMFFADILRAVDSSTDVILFNIDSKADARTGRNALLQVFFKVLNELQGFSSDYPHIAKMERYLVEKEKYIVFQEHYKRLTNTEWVEERDAYEFNQDPLLEALSIALEQSQDSLENWIVSAEDNFPLTIETFAQCTKSYLDSRGPNHKVVFLVDEIGQFIGGDVHLMLNLQTIVEELGTVCRGRAWVVVTSQEDIDTILVDVRSTRNDFSKIQGRFSTRLSLSGANVDEVIQERLLAKKQPAIDVLKNLFDSKGDIIKNQISFKNIGTTFKPLRNADDFALNYPFVPYQFKLIQRIFESIREHGATGLHLAHGERSLLDAFQTAAKSIANKDSNVMVPLYRFYPAIESFLDTVIKRTIDHAGENPVLEPFDCEILKVLFLIRYVEEMKGNVDNIITLCLDQIDADRHALRNQIENSLQRLESQSLISRTNDVYQFLTNEEQDVQREIQNTKIIDSERVRLLWSILFEEIYKGLRKHRYSKNHKDFEFNRFCDGHQNGNRVDNALSVWVVTPFHDDYPMYSENKCILDSSSVNDAQILIHLKEDDRFHRELTTYLKTKIYLKNVSYLKDEDNQENNIKKSKSSIELIIMRVANDNHLIREQLVSLMAQMLIEADYYVFGHRFNSKAISAQAILADAMEDLIENSFNKMAYLEHLSDHPEREIQSILRCNDIGQETIDVQIQESNPRAINELREYINLCSKSSKQIVLHDMINDRFGKRPYGWPDMEVGILLARLLVLDEINLFSNGEVVAMQKCYNTLTTPATWRKTQVILRKKVDDEIIRKCKEISKEIFGKIPSDGEDVMVEEIRKHLSEWQNLLNQWKAVTDAGDYPGKPDIDEGLSIVKSILASIDNEKFLTCFVNQEEDFKSFANKFNDLKHFYEHQRKTWERLQDAYKRFQLNILELEQYDEVKGFLEKMEQILKSEQPYSRLRETDDLIHKVAQINEELVEKKRTETNAKIQHHIDLVCEEAAKYNIPPTSFTDYTSPLEKLKNTTSKTEILAQFLQYDQEAEKLFDQAVKGLEETVKPEPGDPKPIPKPKPICVVKPSNINHKNFLETNEEVDEYLSVLRQELEVVIQRGDRIQIR